MTRGGRSGEVLAERSDTITVVRSEGRGGVLRREVSGRHLPPVSGVRTEPPVSSGGERGYRALKVGLGIDREVWPEEAQLFPEPLDTSQPASAVKFYDSL